MCGRLNVIDNPVMEAVLDILGIKFATVTNMDLRPTQDVASIAFINNDLQQINLKWGIKPAWSKKLLINAQAETAAEKRTFKNAFASQRCVVPCSGWYEWRKEDKPNKQKYLFEAFNHVTLFMAGIWYTEKESNKLVTLTISPNTYCAEYHNRMPLIIPSNRIHQWLEGNKDTVNSLIKPISNDLIKATKT